MESLHRKKSEDVMPVLVSLSLLTDRRGEPVGIATIVKDLSDLKRTEDMLRAKTEDLERSNKDLEEFAYVAAHDLREPLVGIAAYLKVVQRRLKDSPDPEVHKFVSSHAGNHTSNGLSRPKPLILCTLRNPAKVVRAH